MSHEHPIDAAGAHDPESPDDPIDAELSDHLALAARQLALQGAPAEEAGRQAHERFGDVDRIRRQCHWIRKGDEIMLRTATIFVLVALSGALALVAWNSWQAQQNLAAQLDEVSNRMAGQKQALEEALAKIAAAPPATTGRIAGYAYFVDKDAPAEGAQLELLRRSPSDKEWVTERELVVGPDGQFAFEALTPAIYSLYAKLVARPGLPKAAELGIIQTKPRSIAPGDDVTGIELDLRLRAGYVRVGLSRDMPEDFNWESQRQGRPPMSATVRFGVFGRATADARVIFPTLSPTYLGSGPLPPRVVDDIRGELPIVHPYSWHSALIETPRRRDSNEMFRETQMTFVDHSGKVIGDAAPWLAGEYRAEFTHAVKGVGNATITGLFPSNVSPRRRGGGRVDSSVIRFNLFLARRNGAENQDKELEELGVLHRRILAPFKVEDGRVTDLIVQVPDDVEEWSAALQRLLETPEAINRWNYAEVKSLFQSQEEFEQFLTANLFHWFDVQVVGPRPLAEIEAAAAPDERERE